MKTAADNRRNGIQWTPWAQLNDLDFADDLALLYYTKAKMQERINEVAETSARIELNINTAKTKILKASTTSNDTLYIEGKEIKEVDHFTYLV